MWFSNWTSWPLLWRGVAPWFLYKLGRGWMMNSCSTFDKLTFVAVTFLFPHSWWRNNFNNRKFFKQLQFQLWLHVTYAMNIFSASLWVGRWGLCDVSLKNSWSWQSSEEPWLILVDYKTEKLHCSIFKCSEKSSMVREVVKKNEYFMVRLTVSVYPPPPHPLRSAFCDFFSVCLTLDYDYKCSETDFQLLKQRIIVKNKGKDWRHMKS